jgi:TRAP-type uncharacterized transport system fused permease subunit
MLNYARRKHSSNQMRFFNRIFIWLGRKYHQSETFVNYRILKTSRRSQPLLLKEEAALEKGIEAFYEFLFYFIVFGIPLYELYKAQIASEQKEETLNKKLEGM